MSRSLRKATLALHLTTSVGWLGAVAAYAVLDLTVFASDDPGVVAAAWIGMGLLTERLLLPLAIASLVTGVVIAAGSPWGLFRHWWVVVSLLLTVVAVLVLLAETRVIAHYAALARDVGASRNADFPTTLPHSLGGLTLLLLIQVLNVYKPRGLTPYGWRIEQSRRARST